MITICGKNDDENTINNYVFEQLPFKKVSSIAFNC